MVDKCHPSAVLFAAVKGADDMSLKISTCGVTSFFARQSRVMHTHLFPIVDCVLV